MPSDGTLDMTLERRVKGEWKILSVVQRFDD
jgi:hypothetical protein